MRRPETQYADSHGVSIAYQVFGDGPVDVLIGPGFVSNVEMWWSEPNFVRFFERLSRFARVIIFDKRGTGLSDPVTRPPTLDERADDMQAVLDGAGSERSWIMGISESGPHSIVFATTRPERVAGLVLYGVFVARDREGVPAIFRDEKSWEVFFDATEHWGEGRSLRIFHPPAVARPLQQRFWALWERTGGSRAVARQLYDLMWNLDVSGIVPLVSVPTLVLHFEGDFIDVANARWIAAQIPGARLVTFPEGAHVPMNVRGIDLIVDEVERFITGSVAPFVPERALASVVFTDIVGSTERSVAAGEAEWRWILEAHDRIFRDLLVEHRGNEIKTMGDGFLATFDSPVRAVRCARAFAVAVNDLGVSVRAGIHTGEIDIVGDDIAGLGVVIAARVSALAGAGQVLTTKAVRDLTSGSNLAYRPMGEHVLKGVPGRWSVLEVVDESDAGGDLLPTSEPSPHLHGRLLERIAYRAPRLARMGVRASRALPHR
jgi:class 3 adenylate cyclase/pimeloyl-ACP methyl ester carboxylesterase